MTMTLRPISQISRVQHRHHFSHTQTVLFLNSVVVALLVIINGKKLCLTLSGWLEVLVSSLVSHRYVYMEGKEGGGGGGGEEDVRILYSFLIMYIHCIIL